MSNEIIIDVRGPIFRAGYPEAVMRAAIHHIEEEVAREGAEMVRLNLDTVLRHQTGYYRSHVKSNGNMIEDGRIVYGPWLEGTGSRNRTTRFKGYWTFRRTTQQIQAAVGEMAQRAITPYLRELE